MAIGDAFIAAYDDGVDTTVVAVSTNSAIAAAGGALMTGAVVTELVTIDGLADATTLVAGDFLAFAA